MSTYPFLTQNNIEEFLMYAGGYQDLVFDVYSSGSNPLNLNGSIISWKMAPYGQTTAVLTKSGVLAGSPTNRFYVYLDGSDTTTFGGKYVHSYSVTDSSGSVFRPAQGLITVVPAIV